MFGASPSVSPPRFSEAILLRPRASCKGKPSLEAKLRSLADSAQTEKRLCPNLAWGDETSLVGVPTGWLPGGFCWGGRCWGRGAPAWLPCRFRGPSTPGGVQAWTTLGAAWPAAGRTVVKRRVLHAGRKVSELLCVSGAGQVWGLRAPAGGAEESSHPTGPELCSMASLRHSPSSAGRRSRLALAFDAFRHVEGEAHGGQRLQRRHADLQRPV